MSLPKERFTSSNAVEWVRYRVLVRCMIEWLRSVFFFAKSHELNITGLWAYSDTKFYKTICTRKAVYQKRLQSFFIVFKDYTEIWINALRITFDVLIMGTILLLKLEVSRLELIVESEGLVKNRNSVFLSHRESWCSAWSSTQESRMKITCILRGGRQWDGWSLLLLCSAYHC